MKNRTLGWTAAAAITVIIWLAWPFAISMLLGSLIALAVRPLYDRLVLKCGQPVLWAATTVIATGLLILAGFGGLLSLFVTRLAGFALALTKALSAGGPLASSLESASRWVSRYGISIQAVIGRLENTAGEVASRSAVIAGSIASSTFSAILDLFFALLTMYIVLRYWPRMVTAAAAVSPLGTTHTRAVAVEFERAGRVTLIGTVLTGLAQGFFAGIGFWMSGVPQPGFFGTATALASLMPGVGTLLIWVPVGIFLAATGHVGQAMLELVWCALTVVALSDYVIRPRLVGDTDMPAILVYIAIFGGVEALGLAGLIIGPILMTLAVGAVRVYAREEQLD